MSEHGGLLGPISEAVEIQAELGVPYDEAYAIGIERREARLAAWRAEQPPVNVIQGPWRA